MPMSKEYSTAQVAKVLKVGRATLHRWMIGDNVSETLRAPMARKVGGVSVRIWAPEDVERARQFKEKHYCKGRGRKPKPKR
jgi:hypothetical protein